MIASKYPWRIHAKQSLHGVYHLLRCDESDDYCCTYWRWLKTGQGTRGIGSWADYCLVSISQYYKIP